MWVALMPCSRLAFEAANLISGSVPKDTLAVGESAGMERYTGDADTGGGDARGVRCDRERQLRLGMVRCTFSETCK